MFQGREWKFETDSLILTYMISSLSKSLISILMRMSNILFNLIGVIMKEKILSGRKIWHVKIVHKWKDCDADNVCEYDSRNVARFAYCLLVMGSFWITECIPISVTALLPYILFPLFGLGRFSIDNHTPTSMRISLKTNVSISRNSSC